MIAAAVKVGDALPVVRKTITQAQIAAYAEAARDYNPVHLDEQFAERSQFGRRIAHGMLVLAFVAEMLSTAFPDSWPAGGSLKVRFRAPVYPGETVETFGEVAGMDESAGGTVITCRVGCRKPDGAEAVSGEATVALRAQQR